MHAYKSRAYLQAGLLATLTAVWPAARPDGPAGGGLVVLPSGLRPDPPPGGGALRPEIAWGEQSELWRSASLIRRSARYARGLAMARGGLVKRTHTVSVRLTPDERASWDGLRVAAGRRELGAWVRDVVNDVAAGHRPAGAAGGQPARAVPGGPRVVPEVNQDAYRQLVGVAANLNQVARRLNAGGELAGGELAAVLVAVREAARAVQGRGR